MDFERFLSDPRDPGSIWAYKWFRQGRCPKCGELVDVGLRKCPRCGAKL
ncbi:MAG: zinc ribbon domain-containing protein [Candidatus Freyarchaeota archaeon]|nr:zinc ribbon domain-containing protein [Candidatus Freyrarchaeum guaymaensis]